MAQFAALTSRGLLDVLRSEVQNLGLKYLKDIPGGVLFESNWRGCYRANLNLRSATRVILPVLDFPAYQPEDLYHNVRKHDFTKYINLDQTLAIESTVRQSSFQDQRFVALKIKDAIVDQFRDKHGTRPDVDSKSPDLKIYVRVVKNQVSLSIDTSGETLSHRGYRVENVTAPLREHLAAGLLQVADWNPSVPLVDPMCGSGTFLTEAALMARNMSPGSLRKKFGFQKLNGFDQTVWDEVVNEAMDKELEQIELKLYGSDVSRKAVRAAKKNLEEAGVEDDVVLASEPVSTFKNPFKETHDKGMVIVNPPYGERIDNSEQIVDDYKDLAHTLKVEFKGWTCWLLSGNHEATRHLRLKASLKFPVYNGTIECRFLKYEIT